MDLDFETAQEVIRQFRAAHKLDLLPGGIHGIDVVLSEGKPAIRLCIDENAPADLDANALRTVQQQRFTVKLATGDELLMVIAERLPLPRGHFAPGDSASPTGATFYGTAGWNFYYNGLPTVMSNWHVMCDSGNSTPIGRRILLAGNDIASLNVYKPVVAGAGNRIDFAMATLDRESDLSPFMRACPSTCPPGRDNCLIPVDFIPSQILGNFSIGLRCRKIGARDPICRSGTVIGFGDRVVDYDRTPAATFVGQVILSKMTDPGDSGALIFAVVKGVSQAVALNFAGNDQETIASPLSVLNLRKVGDRLAPGRRYSVPEFHFP